MHWLRMIDNGPKGEFVRTDKESGETTVLATAAEGFSDCLVDDAHIYYVESRSNDVPNNLWRLDRNNPTEPVELASGPISELTSNDSHLFWRWHLGPAGDELRRLAKEGGAPEILVADIEFTMLAADNDNVFWAGGMDGGLTMANTDGTAATEISAASRRIFDVTPTGQDVLWAAHSEIWLASRDSGQGEVVEHAECSVVTLSIHDRTLAWADSCHQHPESASIVTYELEGGEKTTVATDQDRPSLIAIDGSGVYWINIVGGSSNQLVHLAL
ncbi:hypothetical protein ACFL6C_05540 [Myxococcota bacterium]